MHRFWRDTTGTGLHEALHSATHPSHPARVTDDDKLVAVGGKLARFAGAYFFL